MRSLKAKLAWSFTLVAGLGAAAAGGYFLGRQIPSAKPASNPELASAQERKVLYWYDPMVPDTHFDKPGRSPFMDMALVPKYADAADPGTVTVSPRVTQNLGVRLAEAETTTLGRTLTTVGAVRTDERRIYAVQARTPGWVEKLYVRATSDPVKRGQALAELYAPEVYAGQREYLLARAANDPELTAAAHKKLVLLGVSKGELRRLEGGGTPPRRQTIIAPADGVVTELNVREGARVEAAAPLFTLADLSRVWVIAAVPEAEAHAIALGQSAEVRLPAYPMRRWRGEVDYLYPEVNGESRTLPVRVSLANPDLALKPGMYAEITLRPGAGEQVLTVPTEAVIDTGEHAVVILAEGAGHFRPVDVQTGRETGERTEIVRGLRSGQKVVASGQFLIDSEASLSGALSRLQGAPAASPEPAEGPAADEPRLRTADSGPGTMPSGHAGRTVAEKSASPAAASPRQPAAHRAEGTIRQVDAQAGTVMLAHGPVASLNWPAMVMSFRAQDPTLLQALRPGMKVRFTFSEGEGGYVITAIEPLGP